MKEKIAHLKKMLVDTDEFQQTMNYFFNVLVTDPNFSEQGEFIESKMMDKILLITGQKLYKKEKIKVHGMQSQFIKSFQLYHGFVALEDRKGVYFYFDKIGGMVSLSGGGDGLVHYCRLTQLPSEIVLPPTGKRFEA